MSNTYPNTHTPHSCTYYLQDQQGKDRVCGEEWLVNKTGAYLPGAYEQVVGFISAYILTENIALHLEALQSYKDRFGVNRKSGEQWLITIKV